MLGVTMKNLQKILKQSTFIVYTTTPHIRTISSSSAVAAKNFGLLLPQDEQHHGGGIIMAACHAKPGSETIKRLQFSPHVTVPHVNITTTGKRGFCSVFGTKTTITIPNDMAGYLLWNRGERKRRMEEQSGARFQISRPDEGVVNNGETLVTIRGNDEQVELLQNLIKNVALLFHDGAHDGSTGIQENSVRKLTVSNEIARRIIGHAGEKLNELEKISGAYIIIPRWRYGVVERVVNVMGNPEQVQHVQELIEELMKQVGDIESTQLSITHDLVHLLLVQGGKSIKEIQRVSGAWINIKSKDQNSDFDVTGERVMTISGSAEQVRHAQERIEELMKQVGDVESTQIRITDMMAGLLLGQGGETIKEIRRVSGAWTHIKSKDQNSDIDVTGERVMTISGSADQIQHAQELIQAHLQENGRVE